MYQLNVWIHILAASIWVGGLIYTAAVVIPFALGHDVEERQRIIRGHARRFRWIGWGSVAAAIATGLGNLLLRLSPISLRQLFNGDAFDPNKVDGFIAVWLPWKLMLVTVMIGLMIFHDVTSIRARGKPVERQGASRAGSRAAALATVVAILVLYVSVRLVRG